MINIESDIASQMVQISIFSLTFIFKVKHFILFVNI